MKSIVKIILIVGAMVSIFGAANTKLILNKGVDTVDIAVTKIKEDPEIKDSINNIKKSIEDKLEINKKSK